MPTAIAVSGADYRGLLPLPGSDVVGQLDNGSGDRRLFFEHQGNRAVRDGDWKLVALDDQPWELYNMKTDRTEMDDLSARFPDRVQGLSAAWDDWARSNQVTPLPRDLGVRYLKVD